MRRYGSTRLHAIDLSASHAPAVSFRFLRPLREPLQKQRAGISPISRSNKALGSGLPFATRDSLLKSLLVFWRRQPNHVMLAVVTEPDNVCLSEQPKHYVAPEESILSASAILRCFSRIRSVSGQNLSMRSCK